MVAGSVGRQLGTGSFWGQQTGPNPTDRAKLGSKRHLICDGRGVPLAIQLNGANRNDSQQALSLVDAIPLLQGERGRPRRRPDCVLGDRGDDAEAIREGLRARHIAPLLAMRSTGHGTGLGRWRWVVGVSRQGHINQSVKVRPRPKDSGLVAGEASWRESKTAEPPTTYSERSMAKAARADRTVSGKCRHRHQGDGSGRSTVEGRAAKRARREGPGPVSTPLVNDSNTLHLVLRLHQRHVYKVLAHVEVAPDFGVLEDS